jgi:hypothetical protein
MPVNLRKCAALGVALRRLLVLLLLLRALPLHPVDASIQHLHALHALFYPAMPQVQNAH